MRGRAAARRNDAHMVLTKVLNNNFSKCFNKYIRINNNQQPNERKTTTTKKKKTTTKKTTEKKKTKKKTVE